MTNKKAQERASQIIQGALESNRFSLFENESEEIARLYDIEVAPSGLAKSAREAEQISKKIRFPVVMKIVSQDILHKSDVGGVKTAISSTNEVKKAYLEILRNVRKAERKARIEGVLIQKMAPRSPEFVAGAIRDAQFGPTVMFGLGGIYVELFKDVEFRIAPVNEEEAISMMKETKSYSLLEGFRGSKPLDIRSTAKVITSLGELMIEQPSLDSIDINPLFIYPKGVLAVDVRMILKKVEAQAS
jgi:acyl-CoA synthetase (NDP forming)